MMIGEEALAVGGVSKQLCVRGYHIYKDLLVTAIERGNSRDHYTVTVIKGMSLGHPGGFRVSSLFIRSLTDVK